MVPLEIIIIDQPYSQSMEAKRLQNSKMSLGARAEHVSPFRVMEILERARRYEASGREIIHMEIGEPDFPTPPEILSAARRHLDGGHMGYTAGDRRFLSDERWGDRRPTSDLPDAWGIGSLVVGSRAPD
jgi:hypothetical protein